MAGLRVNHAESTAQSCLVTSGICLVVGSADTICGGTLSEPEPIFNLCRVLAMHNGNSIKLLTGNLLHLIVVLDSC